MIDFLEITSFTEYNNLKFHKEVIDDLELTVFAEGEPPEIISVKFVGKGFRVVLEDGIKLDSIPEDGHAVQRLLLSEFECILFPKGLTKNWNKLNEPN